MQPPFIIYEKKFPRMSLEDFDRIYNEADKDTVQRAKNDAMDYCKRLFESTVRIAMPERIENSGYFIEMAKEVAEFYEIDTTVTECEDRLIAAFHVDCYNSFSRLKKIILFADDIDFECDNGEIFLRIVYYTHSTYKSGRKVSPIDDFGFLE